ncbi:MAG: ammonia-forming cytochrome c nitrite reductase subunit c552 [Deltaproteobacteria bacterium HGW-Deltaproteobacteria-15]|jgi:nitrite reductase (cytochrome c-552)|nr:MAG: ammonia-forming cytochrome c nitrite reductase subunit c552 [Deltaproteobacteria bacterium HGW-Deltaproteobacteria-15]
MFHSEKHILVVCLFMVLAVILIGCDSPKPTPVKTVNIPDGEIDPAVWGKAYPEEYELWKKTAEAVSARRSKYKTGMDGVSVSVDKLSEFPFMALLYNGMGFGIEYNEPRGHANMVRDQLEIDASRIGSGGVCLSCKTPYAPKLQKEMGTNYYSKPFMEVIAMIPEKNRELGVACIDCHDNKDMSLKISRGFTLIEAYKAIGVDPAKLSRQEMRSAVCGQCHVTYNIPKDKDNLSVGLYFPWQGSKMGNITIENIIKQIRSDQTVKEWKQAVTGFKMAYIRHPEYEFWTNNSIHFKAGASCADCHMPYTVAGVYKVSDHRVMSPVQAEMKSCKQCHAESADWLRERVFSIQDRTASLMIRAGYQCATVAKLFEITHKAQAEGKQIDQPLYDKARDFYEEGFYRSLFLNAENSMGFHNPPEGLRILGDSIAFSTKSEAFLRQALTKAGVDVPIKVDLEIMKYVDERGKKKLRFQPQLEFKDPMGLQERF